MKHSKQSPFRRASAGAIKPRLQVVPRAAEGEGEEVEILLYDEIGFWGIQARDFVRELKAVTASTINLRINSPGGEVFDGHAIYNALRAHPARIVTHVDGIAASIASEIALAGDEILMAENAFLMIHDPWVLTIGNAADHRKSAEVLDKIGQSILDVYTKRSSLDEDEVRALMAEETWLTAEEAVASGFADSIEGGSDAVEEAAAAFDLTVYSHAPEQLTAVAAKKGQKKFKTVRELEAFLRDEGGLSASAAKAVASGGFKALDPRDEDVAADSLSPLTDVAAAIRNLTTRKVS